MVKFSYISKIVIFFFLFLSFCLADRDKSPYAIIVNVDNVYKQNINEGFKKIKSLYLKRSKTWSENLPAYYVDREHNNSSQLAFYDLVLKMNQKEVSTFWKDRRKKNKKELSLREVVREIARNKGAFSVVSKSKINKLPAKVKILYHFGYKDDS